MEKMAVEKNSDGEDERSGWLEGSGLEPREAESRDDITFTYLHMYLSPFTYTTQSQMHSRDGGDASVPCQVILDC